MKWVIFEWRRERGIKITVKVLFLPRQAWLYMLEQNDMSSLVKKGYLGLVWLFIFDFFFFRFVF